MGKIFVGVTFNDSKSLKEYIFLSPYEEVGPEDTVSVEINGEVKMCTVRRIYRCDYEFEYPRDIKETKNIKEIVEKYYVKDLVETTSFTNGKLCTSEMYSLFTQRQDWRNRNRTLIIFDENVGKLESSNDLYAIDRLRSKAIERLHSMNLPKTFYLPDGFGAAIIWSVNYEIKENVDYDWYDYFKYGVDNVVEELVIPSGYDTVEISGFNALTKLRISDGVREVKISRRAGVPCAAYLKEVWIGKDVQEINDLPGAGITAPKIHLSKDNPYYTFYKGKLTKTSDMKKYPWKYR